MTPNSSPDDFWYVIPDRHYPSAAVFDESAWTEAHREAYYALKETGPQPEPPPLDFIVHEPREVDFVHTFERVDLYSDRLKDLIDGWAAPFEREWFPAWLRMGWAAEPERWWILHPLEHVPRDPDREGLHVLTSEVRGRHLFLLPRGRQPVMSTRLRNSIAEYHMDTGIKWQRVPAIDTTDARASSRT